MQTSHFYDYLRKVFCLIVSLINLDSAFVQSETSMDNEKNQNRV